ncbi:D-glycero-alpha-D-manno-heptose-1,7-bisphosphate 7-phosphatase [Desulfovibrio psychrotolerans]|uniref:D,D-heptose 1,7-bisphosphate phosphatase n=1 Tax=Desulfovibrio psychrotolerans TaxID=415242 RepID=A0A7J0BRX6_9BACT|nr:HAD family hydrolase [Desulfovibrio psychrotolerans]GFM35774.1 haloacid dehalogenase [Desulfovibrio psychrotolerans]
MSPIRNILLDRDGTVIHDKHYLSDPEQVEFLPGAVEGLRRLSAAGMRLFILTNQSGIGRGYFSEQDFLACTRRLAAMLAAHGIIVERTLHCPHAPHEKCPCRKPGIGMWDTLHRENRLVPEESVMLGDKRADVVFGLNAGLAASVLVLTGKGRVEAEKLGISGTDRLSENATVRWKAFPESEPYGPDRPYGLYGPHCVAADLDAAADWILGTTREAEQ